ncbi:MAG: hypothetical protein ACOCP8_05495, partial [archaeon]
KKPSDCCDYDHLRGAALLIYKERKVLKKQTKYEYIYINDGVYHFYFPERIKMFSYSMSGTVPYPVAKSKSYAIMFRELQYTKLKGFNNIVNYWYLDKKFKSLKAKKIDYNFEGVKK